MILTQYRNAFVGAIAELLEQHVEDVNVQVKPADPQHGDFSYATFPLARALKKAPQAIAAEGAKSIHVPGLEVTAAGSYINARILPMPFTQDVIDSARTGGEHYGEGDSGKGRTVVIDYSSPNIAKPIAFHHIRSTAMGHAIANLYRSQGWKVEGINYLGDWGKQFGLVAVGFEEYGDPLAPTTLVTSLRSTSRRTSAQRGSPRSTRRPGTSSGGWRPVMPTRWRPGCSSATPRSKTSRRSTPDWGSTSSTTKARAGTRGRWTPRSTRSPALWEPGSPTVL